MKMRRNSYKNMLNSISLKWIGLTEVCLPLYLTYLDLLLLYRVLEEREALAKSLQQILDDLDCIGVTQVTIRERQEKRVKKEKKRGKEEYTFIYTIIGFRML